LEKRDKGLNASSSLLILCCLSNNSIQQYCLFEGDRHYLCSLSHDGTFS
jgi:hypothetical protein